MNNLLQILKRQKRFKFGNDPQLICLDKTNSQLITFQVKMIAQLLNDIRPHFWGTKNNNF